MKKIKILLLIITISITSLITQSCEKEEPCHCGIVVFISKENETPRWIEVMNDCSKNTKKFYFITQEDLEEYPVGSFFCDISKKTW